MKRPLRNRTMGAVREGRGNPSPYSILILGVKVGINLERMWGYLINLFALIEKLLFLTTIVCHSQKDSFSITSDNRHPIILIARHFLNRK